MYLHLGNGVMVRRDDILSVCDLDITSQSFRTREFLNRAEKAGEIINVAEEELPKSFVVCSDGAGQKVYLCQLNSSTLLKRSETTGVEF